jgi:hypothetical protein
MNLPPTRKAPLADPDCFAVREPLETYLARESYVSSSMLRRFARGATPHPPPSLERTGLGEALHAFLLEPERFEQHYLLVDSAQSTAARLSEEDVLSRYWIDRREHAALLWAREAIQRYTRAPLADWLAAGAKELSIYWVDERGARWKARPDCFTEEIILELKTASDVRSSAFARTRRRLGYDLQAAHYTDAVRRLTGRNPRFAFVCLELERPRSLWMHELTADELARAGSTLEALRGRYLGRV